MGNHLMMNCRDQCILNATQNFLHCSGSKYKKRCWDIAVGDTKFDRMINNDEDKAVIQNHLEKELNWADSNNLF